MEEKPKRKKKYYPESAKRWRDKNPDYKKNWLAKNPDYNKNYFIDAAARSKYQKQWAWARLDIDYKDVENALLAQNNSCAGCHIPLTMDSGRMDHCHETGQFRGVLCNSCNLSLGQLKDSPETLRRLADYLERFKK